MTNRKEVFAAHPDWFGMYGGKRRFEIKENNQLCYSNEELFQETVRFVRAQFDHYNMSMVSVMPPALSEIGPYASTDIVTPTVASMPTAAMATP